MRLCIPLGAHRKHWLSRIPAPVSLQQEAPWVYFTSLEPTWPPIRWRELDCKILWLKKTYALAAGHREIKAEKGQKLPLCGRAHNGAEGTMQAAVENCRQHINSMVGSTCNSTDWSDKTGQVWEEPTTLLSGLKGINFWYCLLRLRRPQP